jgi:peroxiredoxin
MDRKLKAGDNSKDFSLQDQDEHELTLSAFRGKKVLLSFHPLAWTSICSEQMRSLENNTKVFDSLNTMAAGISVDVVPSKKAWAESLGIKNTRFLSDFWPHGKVAESYRIFRPKDGFSERANIIIDENQRIVFFKIYRLAQLPDVQKIIDVLKKSP